MRGDNERRQWEIGEEMGARSGKSSISVSLVLGNNSQWFSSVMWHTASCFFKNLKLAVGQRSANFITY